jgi:hypothetical protein
MYALVNFRGVKPIYLTAIWKLKIPQDTGVPVALLSKQGND